MSAVMLAGLLLAGASGRDFIRIPPVKLLRAPDAEMRTAPARSETCYHIKIIRPRVEEMAPMPGAQTRRESVDDRMIIPAPPACDLLNEQTTRRR